MILNAVALDLIGEIEAEPLLLCGGVAKRGGRALTVVLGRLGVENDEKLVRDRVEGAAV